MKHALKLMCKPRRHSNRRVERDGLAISLPPGVVLSAPFNGDSLILCYAIFCCSSGRQFQAVNGRAKGDR